ncbi:hypothetical protein E2C01_066807 [Portunus trituberculatus]|uniref:Peptidase A2 domain-containing protein n=1 Tax=Portunus trituberculatus TaxID=210409 RepID=A0A5B7HUV0_PORTR|nr:hypothetical protein [Portunus trituberculatus]
MHLKDKNTSVRRIKDNARTPSETSPFVGVEISHVKGTGALTLLPDTGADTTILGADHLNSIGLSLADLCSSTQRPTYSTDGSPMQPVIGSVQVTYTAVIRGDIKTVDETKEALEITASKNVSVPHASLPHLPFNSNTTPEQARSYFLEEYADVLIKKVDLQTMPLQPMVGPPMRIHLQDDAQPFALHTPQQILLAYQDDVKQELHSMEAQGIIAPAGDAPSQWCHPLVPVPKPKGGVRITRDLSKLNSQVSWPAHPSPMPFSAIRSIKPGTKYFTTVDALHGYW